MLQERTHDFVEGVGNTVCATLRVVSAGPAYPIGAGRDPRQPLSVEQNPRTINYAEIDWDTIMGILRNAERGDTPRLADLTRRMLTDGHLASNVETRKLAIATAKIAIEPASDDPIDVRGAEDAQRMIDGLPISRIKKDAADGIFVGWACLEIEWEARDAWLWPRDVLWNHPRRFRFGWDFKPYIYDDGRAMADQRKLSKEEQERCRALNIQGMPLDPYRWIVHMPRAFPDYPQMGGVLLSAIRPWWIKANALRYQLAGAEQGGNGRLWGEQDPSADADTKAAFLDNLAKFGAGEIIVTSPGAKVNFINPMAQGDDGIFSALIESSNGDMSKAVLGSTLAVEAGPTGSRAQAETQKSATIDPRAEVDDDEIRHTLHRDLVDVFLELNRWAYGGRKPSVKTTSVWVEEEATIDELALKTGLVTKNQFLTSRGLPPLDVGGDDFVVLPQSGGFGAFSQAPAIATADGTEPPGPPELPPITPGSRWTDTSDGHTVTVTVAGNGRVYFTDEDYVDAKAGPQPTRQHSYAEPTFRERCSPLDAPGGAPAASPLPEGHGDSGGYRDAPSGSPLPSEAHGDLWALDDQTQRAALIAIGHPGLLTAQAMLDGVPLFERLRSSLIDAAGKATSVATLSGVLAKWEKRKDAALAEQLHEVALHGRMAGALFVAQYEAPDVFANGPVALDDRPVPPFLALPFDEAIAAFERRRVVTPEEFEAMDEAARAESFTAAGLAHQTLVQRARDLLLRTLRDGGTFEDFRRALVEDEAALGVTPSSPWYLETVYRTNVQMAYGAGRLDLLTSPAVAAARPYLERRTARDDRVRETHAALEGVAFPQSDPELVAAYSPPYLDGVLEFACRCVYVARRAEDVTKVFEG